MSTEPYRLGIVDALTAIAEGRLTSRDHLESCIARTLVTEPAVGAFTHFDPDAVRRSAAALPRGGALHGMPIGIKDIISTRHVPTEMGSAAFRGHVPDRSAWVVDALARASALMFGKTVTTEFAWRHPGATRNPWNRDHTPGGSSSGSAAAVAVGCVPATLGTQTLGSVLRPAAFCGVVGYKPSFAAIPRTGVHPLAGSLDHMGVFTRNVVDAALLGSVLTGRDGIDVRHWLEIAPAWPLHDRTTPPRIALLGTAVSHRMSDEQRALLDKVAQRLEADGAIVTTLALPASFDAIWSTAQTICEVEGSVSNAVLGHEWPPRVSRPTVELVECGEKVAAVDYARAKDVQQALTREFTSIMSPFDAALLAPAIGEAPRSLANTGDALFCIPGSLLGAPAISLPAGLSQSKLPLGVQLLAPWGEDRRLLEVAVWVERVLGWKQGFPEI